MTVVHQYWTNVVIPACSQTNALILLASMLFVFGSVHADTKGKLAGRIVDQRGDPIIGANVLFIGTTIGAATDLEGYYAVINIPPGSYEVRMSSLGYQTKIIQNVRISAGQTTTLDETLPEQTIELGQEVVVVAERPIVDVKQTSTMAVLSKEDIDVLPVQELKDIVNLQAGVVSSEDGLHFRGGRAGEVQYRVNGVSVNNAFNNQSSVSIDRSLIQEVQVISGTFDAKYGQAMSGVVNTVLRTGGDQLRWNTEVYSGDFVFDGTVRYGTEKFRPTSIRNFQLSLSGPTGLPETYFILSGRRYEFNDYIYGRRFFQPTDKSNFEQNLFYPTGDVREVPIGYSREWSGLGRITTKLLPGVELGYQALVNYTQSRRLNYSFRYNPDGLSTQENISVVHGIDWTHTLSASTFYTVSLRQNYVDYSDYLYESLYDTRYDSAGPPRGNDVYERNAIIQGVDFTRYIQLTNTLVGQVSLTSQVTRHHLVEFGAEAQVHELKFGTPDGYLVYGEGGVLNRFVGVPGGFKVYEVQGGRPILLDFVEEPGYLPTQKYRPVSFALYGQDRVEWNDLTARVGVRFEYFDAQTSLPSDLANPANSISGAPASPLRPTSEKISVIPRVGISFPISNRASVFFSYGHFYQFPALGTTFNNANYTILERLQAGEEGRYGVFGNPDIRAEKTVHYEFGYRHALSENLGLNLNMFYKDIRDLLGVEFIETYTGAEYARFTNVDFGNVFGFTVSLDQRRVGLISSTIDYTLQIAQGNSSDPRETATRAAAGDDPRPRQVPFNWDQRHALNLTVQLSEPRSYVASTIFRISSGQPYTPALGSGFGESVEPNSGRKPVSLLVDLRAEKFFQFMGAKITLFARAFNVLDTRFNNGFVFTDTGSPYYSATSIDLAQLANPTRFYPPRRVEVGFSLTSIP
ncbi:MAG: TonB-dependent receptor [Ignavibacteriae bacterium]|nr:TonB-dependent receptor [Ignavibacteriota bacterium]